MEIIFLKKPFDLYVESFRAFVDQASRVTSRFVNFTIIFLEIVVIDFMIPLDALDTTLGFVHFLTQIVVTFYLHPFKKETYCLVLSFRYVDSGFLRIRGKFESIKRVRCVQYAKIYRIFKVQYAL